MSCSAVSPRGDRACNDPADVDPLADDALLLRLAAVHESDSKFGAVDPFFSGQQCDFRRMVRYAGEPGLSPRRIGGIVFHRDFRRFDFLLIRNDAIDTDVQLFESLRFVCCHG